MKVTEVASAPTASTDPRQITQEQLQQEFNFLRADGVVKAILAQGLITSDEYRLIRAENVVTFPSFISPIL